MTHERLRSSIRALAHPAVPLAVALVGATAISGYEPLAGVGVAALGGITGVALGTLRTRRLHARLREQAARLEAASPGALRDRETGLPTAEMLRSEWDRQLARYQRRGERFVLAVLTVRDRDVPGPITPAAAAGLAEALNQLVRAEDQVYRLESNVFAVLLTGAERDGAEFFLERARKQLRVIDCGPGVESRPIEIGSNILEWHDRPDGYAYESSRSTRWTADGPIEEVPAGMISRWAGQRTSRRRTQVPDARDRRAS